jgi:hypothetical protein
MKKGQVGHLDAGCAHMPNLRPECPTCVQVFGLRLAKSLNLCPCRAKARARAGTSVARPELKLAKPASPLAKPAPTCCFNEFFIDRP